MPESASASSTAAETLYAAIDVGTNTVKLVVADLADGKAIRVFETTENTRLGEGMQAHAHRLREVPMRRTIDILAAFVEKAHELGVRDIVAVGTAALRDAENREEFLRRTHERCGLTVEVIPGEEEARLSYLAVRQDPHWHDCPRLIVIDIGGGSTEVIRGEAHTDRISSRISVNIGAVKLTEGYLKSDPPAITQLAAANEAAAEGFGQVELTEEDRAGIDDYTVVGVGGTITNLGAIYNGGNKEPEILHGLTLRADDLEDQIALFASRTIEERKAIPGLDPRRADIILGGAILLSQALARIGSASVDVSTRGLRWGLLYDRFRRRAPSGP